MDDPCGRRPWGPGSFDGCRRSDKPTDRPRSPHRGLPQGTDEGPVNTFYVVPLDSILSRPPRPLVYLHHHHYLTSVPYCPRTTQETPSGKRVPGGSSPPEQRVVLKTRSTVGSGRGTGDASFDATPLLSSSRGPVRQEEDEVKPKVQSEKGVLYLFGQERSSGVKVNSLVPSLPVRLRGTSCRSG